VTSLEIFGYALVCSIINYWAGYVMGYRAGYRKGYDEGAS
jgi:hypothetical protein